MTTLAFFITARMGSTRLSNKHFLELAGQSVMSRLIERVEAAALPDDWVVITTGRDPINHAFDAFKTKPNRQIFFGDDLHIPRRHAEAAARLDVQYIVSVDGDDPLTSIQAMIDVSQALRHGAALVKSHGLPIGMNSWGYSTAMLSSALEVCQRPQLDTGWGSIFDGHEPELLDHTIPDADKVRMTLDYPEDLEFFRRVFEDCPAPLLRNDADLLHWILSNKVNSINNAMNDTYWQHFNSEK
jgi:spore coat polysaccharide biosynthesis protein SpsF (cytidylyltransferase family)